MLRRKIAIHVDGWGEKRVTFRGEMPTVLEVLRAQEAFRSEDYGAQLESMCEFLAAHLSDVDGLQDEDGAVQWPDDKAARTRLLLHMPPELIARVVKSVLDKRVPDAGALGKLSVTAG